MRSVQEYSSTLLDLEIHLVEQIGHAGTRQRHTFEREALIEREGPAGGDLALALLKGAGLPATHEKELSHKPLFVIVIVVVVVVVVCCLFMSARRRCDPWLAEADVRASANV